MRQSTLPAIKTSPNYLSVYLLRFTPTIYSCGGFRNERGAASSAGRDSVRNLGHASLSSSTIPKLVPQQRRSLLYPHREVSLRGLSAGPPRTLPSQVQSVDTATSWSSRAYRSVVSVFMRETWSRWTLICTTANRLISLAGSLRRFDPLRSSPRRRIAFELHSDAFR